MQKITQKEISQEALALFLEKGYSNVTINDICEACQITKPTFYKYVRSKETLILDLYDLTINQIVNSAYLFVKADTHYEQLLIIFHTLISESQKYGSDLFSQMLISNLHEDHQSFDMRSSLTQLSEAILEKAQERGEIRNPNPASILYRTLAYTYSGYELMWCIHKGQFEWENFFYESMISLLDVREDLRNVHLKYL